MKKLYARELIEKLVSEKELKILEAAWDDEINYDDKVELLLKEEK